MTNILSLTPLLGSGTSFSIVTNADWDDTIFFSAPGSPTAVVLVGQLTASSNTIDVPSTVGIIPGMPITQSPGVPAGAFVGAISSATALTMVNASNGALNATVSDAEAELTFQPIPLDLTGISFKAQLRSAVGNAQVFLTAQTSDGTFFNGTTAGALSFNVPQATIVDIPPGTYVLDIIAMGDGRTINLFPEGPASVVVAAGVTSPLA